MKRINIYKVITLFAILSLILIAIYTVIFSGNNKQKSINVSTERDQAKYKTDKQQNNKESIKEFFKEINEIETPAVVTKREIQEVTTNIVAQKSRIFNDSTFTIKILPNWLDSISSEGNMTRAILSKNGYKLRIIYMSGINERGSGSIFKYKELDEFAFLNIDGVDLLIPTVSKDNDIPYGPHNIVSIFQPYEIVGNVVGYDGKMSNDIMFTNGSYAIDIILPSWNQGIKYDKEILMEIYSMIKSIKWDGK